MKLLLSSLLLASFCALSSWSVSSAGESAVRQSPDVSEVEGETVEITCCWTLEYETVRVKWKKNETELTSKEMIFKNYSYGSLQNKMSNCSQLTLMHVTRGDSGTYICRVIVEIPSLFEELGNGTVITVTAKNNTTGPKMALITSLAVVSPLLLIALVCVCALQRRQVHATRVIYEVPHIDSEEVEMDKHSTSSSRGSSQWCQVPVYESFDYFERVETKESG